MEVEVFVGCGVVVGVLVGVGVDVLSGVLVRVGVGVFMVGTTYSTCNMGAAEGTPSNASAVRLPVPPIIITIELPDDQPVRFTVS